LKDKKFNKFFDFDFQSVRAIDYVKPREYDDKKYFFVKSTDHYTILNPKIAICVIDKKSLPLHTKKIIERK
jgi:hypothetical protein